MHTHNYMGKDMHTHSYMGKDMHTHDFVNMNMHTHAQIHTHTHMSGLMDNTYMLLDTGASCHVIKEPVYDPTGVDTHSARTTIECGGGTIVSDNNKTIKIDVKINNEHSTTASIMIDAALCEDIPYNILSVSQLTMAGFTCTFNNSGATLTSATGINIPVICTNDLYLIRLHRPLYCAHASQPPAIDPDSERIMAATAVKNNAMSMQDAHETFGHTRSDTALRRTCKSLNIQLLDNDRPSCLSCAGNTIRAHNHNSDAPRYIGDWACDYKVNVTDKDTNNNIHFFGLVSYTSLYLIVYPTPNRTYATTAKHFKDFITHHECLRMRSDNATEFKALSGAHPAITWTYTQGYDPQQNGLAERYMGVIMTKVRTLLHANHLSFALWDDAATHAALIWNHTAHDYLQWQTPAQALGVPPLKTQFLLPFGTPVFVYTPKDLRTKNDTLVAALGIYVGYDRNGFRILTAKRGIHTSRDVRPLSRTWVELAQEQPHQFKPLKRFFNVTSPVYVARPRPGTSHTPPEDDDDSDADTDDDDDDGTATGNNDDADAATAPPPADVGGHQDTSNTDDRTPTSDGHTTTTDDSGTRRSKRLQAQHKDTDKNVILITAAAGTLQAGEQVGFNKSQKLDDHALSYDAAIKELDSLFDQGVFRAVKEDKPLASKPIYARMKVKKKADGTYKGRLVADGRAHLLSDNIKDMDTYAPTTCPTIVYMLLSIAASKHLKVRTGDIKSAYTSTEINTDDPIYIILEPSLPGKYKPSPGYIYVCDKALYGFPPSGNLFYAKLADHIIAFGFKRSLADGALFTMFHADGHCDYIIVYVDDLLLVFRDDKDYDLFITHIEKEFTYKQFEDEFNYLSLHVKQHSDHSITVDQTRHADDLINAADMTACNPRFTAITPTDRTLHQDTQPATPLSDADITRYRSLVGKLNYLCHTRFDLLYARHLLSRFLQAPTTQHRRALHHAIAYIKGTRTYGLRFRSSSTSHITAYSDSDFAADSEHRRSITGMTIYMGDNVIYAQSSPQRTVSSSSTSAEIKAAAATSRTVASIQNMLRELNILPVMPTPIHIDNSATIIIGQDQHTNRRMLHLSIEIAQIREYVQHGRTKLTPINTVVNIADIHTKPLAAHLLKTHRQHLCENVSDHDEAGE